MAGKRVFICAAPEDSAYYQEIIAALDAWQVRHTELGILPEPGAALPAQVRRDIRDCEVFVRLCAANTKQSDVANLAIEYFLKYLTADRKRGRWQRRKLVNLILDSAYPLDDEERKTLFITTQDKARALWLEELAAPVGVATLKQQVSRRALLGMGVGATLTLVSASAAGTLLYQQSQPPQPQAKTKISGRPNRSFQLSDISTSGFGFARIVQDDAAIYAQPDLSPSDTQPQADSSVYILSPSAGTQRRTPIATPSDAQGELIGAAQGMLFLRFDETLYSNNPNPSAMTAVSASDGSTLWRVACNAVSPPAISDGALYCVMELELARTATTQTLQESISAFRQKDGSLLWRTTDVDVAYGIIPAVANGRLYIGSTDHHVYCLDARTGHTRWDYLTRGPVLGTPAVANGLVYIGSHDGAVYALDADSGKLQWRFATSDSITAMPLIHDGVAYVGSHDSYIYALDARSGTMFWRAYVGVNPHTDDRSLYEINNTFAIYRNVLFATVNGGLYAFDIRDGSQRWRYIPVTEQSGSISPPVVSNGLALIGASDNQVYAVNP